MDKKKKQNRWKIQLAATLATNPFLGNFLRGKIYKGNLKSLCVPGLNCYSCPGAAGSCPIGSLQAVIGSSKYQFSYYVVGFLIFVGVLLGRLVCGFLCPFGCFQELLHKIPSKKFSTKPFRILTKVKYIILLVFVLILPITVVNEIGMGDPFSVNISVLQEFWKVVFRLQLQILEFGQAWDGCSAGKAVSC